MIVTTFGEVFTHVSHPNMTVQLKCGILPWCGS